MAVDPIPSVEELEVSSISMGGIEIKVPLRWEARISKSNIGQHGSRNFLIAHASTIPLPSNRGDYGSNVVERLSPTDLFVSLVEFGPEAVNTPLFPPISHLPDVIAASEFHPSQLQRAIPGQAGKQTFFTYSDRSFCLYVVLGSFALRSRLMANLTTMLAAISIKPS